MLDHLRQIAIFAKTAEQGSFRKAADVLQLSPSVVSHHISSLEQRLDVALFYRSTRQLSLTSDGERLLASANMLVSGAEDFISTVSNQSAQLIGQLKITLPAVMSDSELVNHIGNFSKENPCVRLTLDFSDTKRNMIDESIDLAIKMVRSPKDSSLIARKLSRVDRVLIASPAYLKSRPEPKIPEDLNDWGWIELSPVGLNNTFTNHQGQQRTVKAKSHITVNNAFALRQLIKNGNGIGVFPRFLVEELISSGELKTVLNDWQPAAIETYAVWPANAPRNGITKRLVNFLASTSA